MEWSFERVAGPYPGVVDGPAWDGSGLLFCVVAEDRILRYEPGSGAITEFRKYSSGTRGLGFDAAGNLYGCQGGSRRIVRFNPDGSTYPMQSRLDGRFHNYPDDLVGDREGRIWFSDPVDPIPIGGPQWPPQEPAVLRLERAADESWQIRRMTSDSTAPRGVRLSPDERTLYVADCSEPNGKHELRAYPILADGSLGTASVLHTFGADEQVDGIGVDRTGTILVCAGAPEGGSGSTIYVISPSGDARETYAVPAGRATNCVFGDAELRSLYVTTADGQLFRVANPGMQGIAPGPSRPSVAVAPLPALGSHTTIPAAPTWTERNDRVPLVTDKEAPGFRRIVPEDADMETIVTDFIHTEGPVWNVREGCLIWSDIAGDTIYRWHPEQGTSVLVRPSGHSNGLTLDREGRLVAAGFGGRTVWRREHDGNITTLCSHYQGQRIQAPNDIVVKSDGSIYWTEGVGALFHPGLSGDDVQQYLDFRAIFCLAPDGSGPTIAVGDAESPNGIAFSPDETLFYINDTRLRHIRVFDVQKDGNMTNGRVFYEDEGTERGAPDGMKVDVEGNVYLRASGGIHVIDPAGHLLGRIRVPDMSNHCWGDADWRSVYIAGRSNIYRVRLNIPGVPV